MLRGVIASLVLPSRVRIDVFQMIADLLESGMSLEKALDIAAETASVQGQAWRAGVLRKWRDALVAGRFSDTAARWVPPAEAMIFGAYGRVEAGVLFAGAARVAEMRSKQKGAMWKALALPVMLIVGLIVLLWGAGGHFIPVLEGVSDPGTWGMGAQVFRMTSVWLHSNFLLFLAIVGGLMFCVYLLIVYWTGPGRQHADKVAPFSLYRTLTGSAFLFVVLEFVSAGVDVNERTFTAMKKGASPYARHRIDAIQRHMAGGAGFGASMRLAGHGFPDPALVPVVAALDGTAGWERKLGGFVERWVGRSDEVLRSRAALMNGTLLLIVTFVMAGGIDAMFGILQQAGNY